jgi:hypothetical protein
MRDVRLMAALLIVTSLGLGAAVWLTTSGVATSEGATREPTRGGSGSAIETPTPCTPVPGNLLRDASPSVRTSPDATSDCALTAGPTPVIPEAPLPVFLPITAVVFVAALAVVGRRGS